jgi:hypothetical protein
MPLPLLAVPIAMGAASAGGAIFRASAAKKQAEAMMPEEYKRRLAELERREAAGTLGLTEVQRGMMETEGATSRAGLMADQRARQLQQAQSNAAIGGREFFLQDLASQTAQQQALSQQNKEIQQANEIARQQQEQQMLELQQRQADAEAARKAANRQLAADLLMAGVSTGVGAYGASQMQTGQQAAMKAMAAGDTGAASQAMLRAQYGSMAIGMAGSFGGAPRVSVPQVPVQPVPMGSTLTGGMSPAQNPMMTPNVPGPYGAPTIVGYQQMPDGTVMPVYGVR